MARNDNGFGDWVRGNWVWLLVALFVAGLIGYALMPRPLAVEVASVKRGDLVVSVEGDGIARAREIYVVSAPLAGRLLRVEAEPGDAVVKDETELARIRPTAPAFLDERSVAEAEARLQEGIDRYQRDQR